MWMTGQFVCGAMGPGLLLTGEEQAFVVTFQFESGAKRND